MGYYIRTHASVFRIRNENLDKFFGIVKDLMSPTSIKKNSSFDGYSWINTEAVLKAVEDRDISGVFREWRWSLVESYHEPDLACIDIHLSNGEQKIGDEEILFAAIAPVVEDGSFIEVWGEDNAAWRWSWRNGKFFVAYSTEVVYGTDEQVDLDKNLF